MRNSTLIIAASLGMFCASSARVLAEAKVEEHVVGPVADGAKYVVSPQDVHLATVARKGSRGNVIVDGVAGPKLDDVFTTALPYVDPRPFAAKAAQAKQQPN